ncbi:MAG: signal peptidase I [Alphaproteobacteria bacterium]
MVNESPKELNTNIEEKDNNITEVTAHPKGNKNKKQKKKETPLEIARSIFILLFILLAIRTFIWEPFRIPSESMLPRLEIGDFISVNKSAYGYSKKSPSFFTVPFLPDGRFNPLGGKPKRGDVIVFKRPSDNRIMIKRLIGFPEDKIKVQNGIVYINDIPLKREKIDTRIAHARSDSIFTRYREYMPNGKNYIVYEVEVVKRNNQELKISGTEFDNTHTFVIPAKSYFFMGDDRDLSADSRDWGSVEETYLLGKATLINLNFFQSLKGKRIFMKMYTDKDYDTYQQNHTMD